MFLIYNYKEETCFCFILSPFHRNCFVSTSIEQKVFQAFEYMLLTSIRKHLPNNEVLQLFYFQSCDILKYIYSHYCWNFIRVFHANILISCINSHMSFFSKIYTKYFWSPLVSNPHPQLQLSVERYSCINLVNHL